MKKALFALRIVECVVLVVVVSFLVGQLLNGRTTDRNIADMNARELHYDADGWFILVNRECDLVGVYMADMPVTHFYMDTDMFTEKQFDIPCLVYPEDKSEWWFEDHTKE